MVITIDGPAGAGKSTIAKLVAKELGITYIDTGAMYRAVTYKVLKNGMNPACEDEVGKLAWKTDITLKDGNVFLDGEDVTQKIRVRDVTNKTSLIAANKEVRRALRKLQRQIASDKDVVMEGRDIGSVVFPEAQFKFYLDASLSERARRRWSELKAGGIEIPIEEIVSDINKRDNIDLTRGLCPLKVPDGAIIIDSTNKSIQEVVKIIVDAVKSQK